MSLGTVSAHLAVLRNTDIATGARVGRHVIYRLTDRGTDLVQLLDGHSAPSDTRSAGES